MRWIVGLWLSLVSVQWTQAADVDALYRALERSDTATVQRFVTDHYRDAGISVNDTLTWENQAFDQIVNWYNQHTAVIRLSELPGPGEVEPYWDNWSAVLTQGRWDWREFFADETEAALLANFNQFLLAAHEYGHALTYRYDPEHEARFDYAINCREYLADRLAAALLEEVSALNDRIAALQRRYRALIDEINRQIAPEYRYDVPTLAALEADCRVLAVEQPTEESMTPYASAFFVRHALLQAADLPPLAELYATHLLPRWKERQYPASGRAGAVTTGAPLNVSGTVQESVLTYEQRHILFAPDGALFVLDAGTDPEAEPPRVRFSYGPVGGPIEAVIPPRAVEGLGLSEFRFLMFSAAASLGPDRFVALSGGGGLGTMPIVLFDVRRTDGTWQLSIIDLEPDRSLAEAISFVGLAQDPFGGLAAYLLEPGSADRESRWRRIALDPKTLQPVGTTYLAAPQLSYPVAAGANGETFFFDNYRIVAADAEGGVSTYAGAGLQGFKDNLDPLLAEFAISGAAIHPRSDGGMDVLDYDSARQTYILRHIAPAQ